ncbi:unnamed protein product [Auanema sp. JU1783]|nr:unnamed protein product [Auanema sp. JU1783]
MPIRQRSKVWDFFKKDEPNKVAFCNICKKQYKLGSSTTTMADHMKKDHNEIWKSSEADTSSIASSEGQIRSYLKPVKSLEKHFSEELLKFVCSSNLSLRGVENPHFLEMMRLISMPVPSRRTLGRNIISTSNDIVAKNFNDVENSQHVVLGTDSWTTINAKN